MSAHSWNTQPGSLALLVSLVFALSSCGVFGPSTGEEEDIGSNTNWLVGCSESAECGAKLECICGACSRYCSGSNDCEEGQVCPVDRGAFQLACPQEAAVETKSSCRSGCGTDSDCVSGHVCVGGACANVEVSPCPEAHELVWATPPGSLQARVGSLFGENFSVPASFPTAESDGGYAPTELAVRVLDQSGAPVVGCEIVLVSEEASGFAYAREPNSDANGRVSFLWVAGTAPTQTLSPHVYVGADHWLSIETTGEARRHDEAPFSNDTGAPTTTRASSLRLSFATGSSGNDLRTQFVPFTFPPRTIYGAFVTDALEIWFVNAGTVEASQADIPQSFRHRVLRAQGTAVNPATVLFSKAPDECQLEGTSIVCQEPSAWILGEEQTLQVRVRHLAQNEIVSDYDFGEAPPCEGSDGCTDYSISVQRSGGELELHAILRSPTVETLAESSAFIDGDYVDGEGLEPSCLLTQQSRFFVAQEELLSDKWEPIPGARLEAASFGTTTQVCANYSAFAFEQGYHLSTGGPSPVSTPHLPGTPLSLE